MNIRKNKLAYEFYNFFRKKDLSYNIPLYKKYGINKKYYSPVSSVDFEHINSPLNLLDKKDSREELPKNPDFQALEKDMQEALLPWSEKGYAILPNFFSEEKVDKCNKEIAELLENKKVKFKYTNKIMFAYRSSELINEIANDKRLKQILRLLLSKEVDIFQSINFIKGSGQRAHSDSIHMTTFPYGNLIAVWIALEDITEDSGPLHYYPGSHKLPYVMNPDYGNRSSKFTLGPKDYSDYEDHIEDVINNSKLEKKIFLAKKGDILIWHANLLHGGEPVTNPESTRKSMVFHYLSNDSICFHEITERPTIKVDQRN